MISIIIPLYNKEKKIGQCLDSILSQSFSDFECVVIDDGSTDKSACVVKSYDDARIHYYYQINQGVSSARNNGVALSKGDFIVFIDADDLFLPGALNYLNSAIQEKNVDCVVFNFYFEYKSNRFLYIRMKSKNVSSPYKEILFNNFWIRPGNAVFRKKSIEKMSYDQNLSRSEDTKYMLDVVQRCSIYYENIPVMIYTDDCKNLSVCQGKSQLDFACHLNFLNKSFFEKIFLARILKKALKRYPQERAFLLKKYSSEHPFLIIESMISIPLRIKRYLLRKIGVQK